MVSQAAIDIAGYSLWFFQVLAVFAFLGTAWTLNWIPIYTPHTSHGRLLHQFVRSRYARNLAITNLVLLVARLSVEITNDSIMVSSLIGMSSAVTVMLFRQQSVAFSAARENAATTLFPDALTGAAAVDEQGDFLMRFGGDWDIPSYVGRYAIARKYARAAERRAHYRRLTGKLVELVAGSLTGAALLWYFSGDAPETWFAATLSILPITIAVLGHQLSRTADKYYELAADYRTRVRDLSPPTAGTNWKMSWMP
ncbi:hypothetical protein [Rhodococcus sp. NPDC057529]|uniref:hypothetical protein n=1 Tax=Rhodococcus sp. NPDC057529 TaxID=3346158 RepID=UPI00366F09AE